MPTDKIRLEPFFDAKGRLRIRCADTGREIAGLTGVRVEHATKGDALALHVTASFYPKPARPFYEPGRSSTDPDTPAATA